MEYRKLVPATLDIGILGVQLVFSTDSMVKGNTVTSIDIINNYYKNPDVCRVKKIVGLDKNQGVKGFFHSNKRYIIGVCGVKHGSVFVINIDDKIYEEYAFVGAREASMGAKDMIVGDINRDPKTGETFITIKFDYHTIQHDDVTFSFAMDKENDVKFQFKYSDFHPDGVCDEVGYVRIIRTVIRSLESSSTSNLHTQFRFFDFADGTGDTATVTIAHMLDYSEWTITTRDKDGNMHDTIGVTTVKVSNTNFALNTSAFVFRGCKYIISIGGEYDNSIIVINLSSNEGYQYNFKNVDSIRITSIDCDDGALGPVVKIGGDLVLVKDNVHIHRQYRIIVNSAFNSNSMAETKFTLDNLNSRAYSEFIETTEVKCGILNVRTLCDYTKYRETDTEETAIQTSESKKDANELVEMRGYFKTKLNDVLSRNGIFAEISPDDLLELAGILNDATEITKRIMSKAYIAKDKEEI